MQACFCAFIPILFLLFGLCVDVSVCVSAHRVDLYSKQLKGFCLKSAWVWCSCTVASSSQQGKTYINVWTSSWVLAAVRCEALAQIKKIFNESALLQERESMARRQMLEEERRRREEAEKRLQDETFHRQQLVEKEVKMRAKNFSQVSKMRLNWVCMVEKWKMIQPVRWRHGRILHTCAAGGWRVEGGWSLGPLMFCASMFTVDHFLTQVECKPVWEPHHRTVNLLMDKMPKLSHFQVWSKLITSLETNQAVIWNLNKSWRRAACVVPIPGPPYDSLPAHTEGGVRPALPRRVVRPQCGHLLPGHPHREDV